jgi:hypothetical protein
MPSPSQQQRSGLGIDRGTVLVESAFAILSIAAGLTAGLLSQEVAVGLTVGLFLELLLVIVRMRWRYEPFLNRLAQDFDSREHPFDQLADMAGRSLPLQLLEDTPREWVFRQQFDRLAREFRQNLRDIEAGTFTTPLQDVQDISFDVCESLTKSAFCTAPEVNLNLFRTAKGHDLKKANFDAAARLEGNGGFTRMFIFKSFASIAPEDYLLMKENVANKVRVLVALEHKIALVLKRHNWDARSDFGLWDGEYLMTIRNDTGDGRTMEVSNDKQMLATARDVVKELQEIASDWHTFEQEFSTPLNGAKWTDIHGHKMVRYEEPNGPAVDDCDAMIALADGMLQSHDVVAVYGLTGRLIDAVGTAIATKPDLELTCDIIDGRRCTEQAHDKRIAYRVANWLAWKPSRRYRAVFGDDVIPNLGIWQIPLFFRRLYDSMLPGGRFITRTTAIYTSSPMHPSWNESLARLRRFDRSSPTHIDGLTPADLTEGAVYEIAWPTLHSREFYDSEQCSLDFGGWDKRLKSEPGDADFLAKLRLQYNHRVTSLEFERLKQLASPYFEVVDDYPVHSVWAANGKLAGLPEALQVSERFREYYRILVFERCDHATRPAE